LIDKTRQPPLLRRTLSYIRFCSQAPNKLSPTSRNGLARSSPSAIASNARRPLLCLPRSGRRRNRGSPTTSRAARLFRAVRSVHFVGLPKRTVYQLGALLSSRCDRGRRRRRSSAFRSDKVKIVMAIISWKIGALHSACYCVTSYDIDIDFQLIIIPVSRVIIINTQVVIYHINPT
jgi:hypothetical protein